MSSTRLFDALDELVDDCSGEFGDWDEVLRRAAIAPAAKAIPAAVASRRHRESLRPNGKTGAPRRRSHGISP